MSASRSVLVAQSGRFVGLLLAASAQAQVSGFIALPDCSGVDPTAGAQGELVVMATGSSFPLSTAALFDLRSKGGSAVEGTTLAPEGFASRLDLVEGTWQFVHVALPPVAATGAGRLVLVAVTGDSVGAVTPLTVGDSLPAGVDRGIGLRIAPGGPYPVNFGSSVRSYPRRDSEGSVTLAFAPLAESNPTARGDACRVSGFASEACTTPPCDILGYAVYRVPTPFGAPPGPDAFTAALSDGDPATGYVGFVDLRKFRLNVATDVTVDDTVNDLDPNDGASLHDPDGRMYSGDEVVLWTDAAIGPRAHPVRAPLAGMEYSYAVQPVTHGRLSALRPCYTVNCILDGDHLRDLDGDGADDAVDLDGLDDATGDVELISPQAEASEGGLDGLGLTFRSKLLLSATMTVPPAPAVLRRDVSVTSLRPLIPALSTFLPLTSANDHVVPIASGDVDPDLEILETSDFPLVFYAVTGQDDLRLSVSGAAGARRVRFTF